MGRRLAIVLVGLACVGTVSCHASNPFDPTYVAPVADFFVQHQGALGDVSIGSTFVFRAYAQDTDEVYRPVTSETIWSSSNTHVVRAAPSGGAAFEAVGPGVVTITGTYSGFTDSLPVRVRAAPRPFPYLETWAPGRAVGDARLILSPTRQEFVTSLATWTSSDPRVATVDRGRLTVVGVGTAEITASYDGLTSRYAYSVPPPQR